MRAQRLIEMQEIIAVAEELANAGSNRCDFVSHLPHVGLTFTSPLPHVYLTFASPLSHLYLDVTSLVPHFNLTLACCTLWEQLGRRPAERTAL